jgi:hypothetical protein
MLSVFSYGLDVDVARLRAEGLGDDVVDDLDDARLALVVA